MKYIKLVIEVDDKYREGLIAELFEMDFEGIEEREGKIIAYITKENFTVSDREQIEILLSAYPGGGNIESEEVIADQNWNETWEQTIKPQTIGTFFVKPTWSQETVPEDKILLEIDPKMSFGTGYHETTRLMLRALPGIIKEDDFIIDAGTGSGILSIAATKLGANRAFAFDIDEWSVNNTKENILINGVEEQVTVKKGSAETIPDDMSADTVLANIEKNTILRLLDDLRKSVKNGGNLLLSGLLESDRDDIIRELNTNFRIQEILQENEWIAVHAKKEVK